MGQLIMPKGTVIETKEGQRYEFQFNGRADVNDGQRTFEFRAGDTLRIGKAGTGKLILLYP